MKINRLTVMAGFLLLVNQSQAVTVNIPQQLTAGMEKGRFIDAQSGFDGSRKAAYMQADMVFSQICGCMASIGDLKRISRTPAFGQLYSRLKSGQVVGLSESRKILVDERSSYCKGAS